MRDLGELYVASAIEGERGEPILGLKGDEGSTSIAMSEERLASLEDEVDDWLDDPEDLDGPGPEPVADLKIDSPSGETVRAAIAREDLEPFSETVDELRAIVDGESLGGTLVGDGGSSECGLRTCTRDAAVTYTKTRGAIRTRCDVHALTSDVDGVGEARAERILEEIELEALVDRVQTADGIHAPTVLSRIDGLGPTNAAKIAKALDESNVAASIRDRNEKDPDVATDGGRDVPPPGVDVDEAEDVIDRLEALAADLETRAQRLERKAEEPRDDPLEAIEDGVRRARASAYREIIRELVDRDLVDIDLVAGEGSLK